MNNVSGVKLVFDHKGMIEACAAAGQEELTHDKAEEIAIEVGAEEIHVSNDVTDDKSVFQVWVSVFQILNRLQQTIRDSQLSITYGV